MIIGTIKKSNSKNIMLATDLQSKLCSTSTVVGRRGDSHDYNCSDDYSELSNENVAKLPNFQNYLSA